MQSHYLPLIRAAWAQLQPIAPQAAALFYTKLFERDPALRGLFKGEMAQQGERLMQMIGAAIGLLDRPVQLQAALAGLGQRHAGYGVQAAHYETVGAALIDTLAEGLGDAFTPAQREAWTALYTYIATRMQLAAALQPA
jgi:hemoglobin-like flavoprotein